MYNPQNSLLNTEKKMLPKLKSFLLLIFVFACDFNSFSMQKTLPKNIFNPGLKNAGNSCYFNSIIQCLSAIPELTTPLIKNGKNIYLENSIPWLYVSLLEEIEKKKLSKDSLKSSYYIPLQTNNDLIDTPLKKLYEASAEKYFHGSGNQEDADEFLNHFYNSIFDVYNMQDGEKNFNIKQNFVFETIRILKHSKCNESHFSSLDQSQSLDLHVVDSLTKEFSCLKDILNNFFTPEHIENYSWEKKCENGTMTGAESLTKFFFLPKIFTITLKRFKVRETPNLDINFFQTSLNDIEEKRPKFVGHHVDIPMTLKIDNNWIYEPKDNHLYELFGVVVYIEWLIGGHYVAYVKNSTGNEWTKFNDDKTKEANHVANEPFFKFPQSKKNEQSRKDAVNFYLNAYNRNLFFKAIYNNLYNRKKLQFDDVWAIVQKENLLKEIEKLKKDLSKTEKLKDRQQNMIQLENCIENFHDESVNLNPIFMQPFSYEAVNKAFDKIFIKNYKNKQDRIKQYYENEFKDGIETQSAPYILFYRYKDPELLKNQNPKQNVQGMNSDKSKENKNLLKNLLQKLRDTLQKLKEKLGSG
jgi:ubiquitin C-terminal hydrolase